MHPLGTFENVIALQSGCCFLSEYMEDLRQKEIYWWTRDAELKYLIMQLYELHHQLELRKIYFSCLDTEELILVESKVSYDTVYRLKCSARILWASNDFRSVKRYKPAIFPVHMQQFNSHDERMLAERYVLGKVILQILMDSIIGFKISSLKLQDEKFDEKNELRYQSCYYRSNEREVLIEALQQVSEYYKPEYVTLLRQLLLDLDTTEAVELTLHNSFNSGSEYIRDLENSIKCCKFRHMLAKLDAFASEQQFEELLRFCDEMEFFYRGMEIMRQSK